jgi:uncharacterized protein (DUF2461 family)
VSAVASATGKKPMSLPGIYIQLSPEDFRLYGGVYQLDTKTLHSVRTEIMDNEKKFLKLINDEKFKDYYGEIQGEKSKRIDKEFRESAERIPLMYNKNFYFFKKFPAKDVLKDNFLDTIIEGYKIGRNLGLFFNKPMSL